MMGKTGGRTQHQGKVGTYVVKKNFPVTVKGKYDVTWFLQGCQASSRVTHVLIH